MKKLYLLLCLILFCCVQIINAQPVYFEQKGKIINMPNPCETEPCLPGMVFGFETTSNNYVLTINSYWIWSENNLIFEDVEYFIDDEVEITGIITPKQDLQFNEYTELEIKTIKKLNFIHDVADDFQIKLYPNPTTGVLNLIQERITNYELGINKVEIFDIYGKKHHLITPSSNHLINVAHLPAGIYFLKISAETGEVVKKVVKQ